MQIMLKGTKIKFIVVCIIFHHKYFQMHGFAVTSALHRDRLQNNKEAKMKIHMQTHVDRYRETYLIFKIKLSSQKEKFDKLSC